MRLPEDIRHLFVQWLDELYKSTSAQKSRITHTYYQALKSLKACPTPIQHPNELINLKYFGAKLVEIMNQKLSAYCEENDYDMPVDTAEITRLAAKKRSLAESETTSKTTDKPKPKRTKKKKYIPEMNSGGYAIMVALHINDRHGNGMTKQEIIRVATPFCTSSFQSNPSTGNFYSAWSSIKTLMNNDYIIEEGNPKYYSLTDEGTKLAAILKEDYESVNGVRSATASTVSHRSYNAPPTKKRATTIPSANPLNTSSPNVSKNISDSIVSSSPFRGGVIQDLKNKGMPPSSPLAKNKVTVPVNSPAAILPSASSRSEYQIWRKGSYEIKFVLDTREVFSKEERNFFATQLEAMDINLDVRALPVGDGTWIAVNRHTKQESTLNIIFERKRLDDFSSSIIDGRFREQKDRLEKTGMTTIFYIIEEQTSSDLSMHAESMKTCIAMNTTYSTFHTVRTKSPDETMRLINDLTNLVNKRYANKTLMVLEPRNLTNQDQYKDTLVRMRGEFVDKEVVYSYSTFYDIMGKNATMSVKEGFIRMLMAVKGVGLEKAIAIQNHYKVPYNFLMAYKKCHSKNPKECKTLLQLEMADEVGVRKIGPALSAKLATIWCQGCQA